MELPIVLHKSRAARLTRHLYALPSVALLLSLTPLGLFAQHGPAQDWPPDDGSNGEYVPAPQAGYGQPQYAPPQSPYASGPQSAYGQPRYAPAPQYGYGQQGFAPQQQYPQQPYQTQAPYQTTDQPFSDSPYAGGQYSGSQVQPLSADQLEQMVAPIALYPDTLVAQILAASTYPAQVAAADQWLRAQGNAPPEQIAYGASAQTSWDPSVKALTAFPQVLAMLDRNLEWTTNLGNAYYNQPQDVLQTIQVMRERAESAGNLQSNPQAEVSNNQGYIDINPPDPQTVYVPTYNPWQVYGQPVSPYPGFSLLSAIGAVGSFIGSAAVQYGPGIATSAFMSTPFGLLGWGIDWLAHAILFDHGDYFTHSRSVADWGFPRGGPRAYPGHRDWARGGDRSGWSHSGYDRASFGREAFNRPYGRPISRYGDARTQEGFNRGFASRGNVYGRPALPGGYSRGSEPYGQRQEFASRGVGSGNESGFYERNGANFGGRSGLSYRAPSQSYRPQTNYQRGGFGGRGSEGYQAYGGKPEHSGGFHLFGGGHQSNAFGGRGSFGGGHSSWGGGGFKAPKASHFGGGGHSGGGGHFGGHSGGHGGGHGGGHHH